MALQRFTIVLSLLATFFASQTQAQVFDLGTSDSGLFDTVTNLPEDQVSISGGVGDILGNTTGQLNVQSGGSVDSSFDAYSGGELNISGGTVGNFLRARRDSEINISGGTVGDHFSASAASVVNISGGTVGEDFNVFGGGFFGNGIVNISGGNFGNNFEALSESEVNLFGTEFLLNGTPLNLALDQTITIINRGAGEVLSGTLSDGTAFDFELNDVLTFSPLDDFFADDATVTVTLAAPSVTLGDVSGDGLVNFLDISPFIAVLTAEDFQDEADIDGNGAVNFLDIGPFIALLNEQ